LPRPAAADGEACDDRRVLQLRTADAADIETLINWFPDAAAVRDWAGPGLDWPLDRTAVTAHRADLAVHSWAACRPSDPQRLVGYIELVQFSADAGRLDRVVIAPDERGKRLGAHLVTLALDEARRIGLNTVDLLVFAENHPARRTYNAVGFTDHGGLPDYPSVIRMSLDLKPNGGNSGDARQEG
jgi:GNAT superfamily N-acetyltransferase